MRNIFVIIMFTLLSLSCNDEKPIKQNSQSKDSISPSKTSVKPKVKIGVIYQEGGIKVYGDTTIEKNKIYYGAKKFEPFINFSDFKVAVENGKAKIDLKSHKLGSRYRTAISRGYDNPESLFAGHYSFAFWGCGVPCSMSVIVDRRNGKIYEVPMSAGGYDFRKDSRMLILNPPDSLGYYDNCPYCEPEIYILNERTKKFEKKEKYKG